MVEAAAALAREGRYGEIVFCGYGEPTCRAADVLEAARALKSLGLPLRLDTNGHGNMINRRDIVPELAEVFDARFDQPQRARPRFVRPALPPRRGGEGVRRRHRFHQARGGFGDGVHRDGARSSGRGRRGVPDARLVDAAREIPRENVLYGMRAACFPRRRGSDRIFSRRSRWRRE